LAKALVCDRKIIRNIAEEYKETNPESFKNYLDNHNNNFEYYSPTLCEIIKKRLEKR
jgi:hypothetical protein